MRKLKDPENAKISGGCYGALKEDSVLVRTVDSNGNIDPNYLKLDLKYDPGSKTLPTYGEKIVSLADAEIANLTIIARVRNSKDHL